MARLPQTSLKRFEIYVSKGFSEYEASAIAQVLKVTNDVLGTARFSWRYVSQTPGLVSGECGMIVRAEPAMRDHDLSDIMIVVGARSGGSADWFSRVRLMQKLGRPVALLSNSATAYIRTANVQSGAVTTHWRDGIGLREDGRYSNLTNRLSEMAGGVITAAGSGSTEDLVIGLLGDQLAASEITEVGNRLMLPLVRKSHADQPSNLSHIPTLHDSRIKSAIKAMQESLDAPLHIIELAQEIGVSTRHLERMFKEVFDETPARFYKRLRTTRARAMIEETQMPIIDIAVANGFGTSSSLSEAIKKEYGVSATRLRARGPSKVLTYDPKV